MELPLVVGVDGSESSLRAVDWAADEASLHGRGLHLVYASKWERYEGLALAHGLGKPSERVFAENLVGSATERAHRRHPQLKITAETPAEDAATALLNAGRNAFLLVTGSHGRSGVTDLLLGSVSLTVAARADCPVVVLRGSHDNQIGAGMNRSVALGVADPAEGDAAVRFAVREAAARGVSLWAVRAWRLPALEAGGHPLTAGDAARHHERTAAERIEDALREVTAEHPGVTVHQQTGEGPARRVLLNASATVDLMVVGALRRPGYFGLQLGPVAHTLLHHSACPVAVVPERAPMP
ncbi:universal stress protein [Streptomyces sp. NPDC047315]|uniref:universal stress protein n=1 Tax=Streptomyces sp. NPDC047315 TaxID=3155142 RepID=UPI003408312E